jgi:uncharacterized protein (TIGR01244 family)
MAMALAFTWLSSDFATAPQLTTDDVAAAAAAGFRSVVNNRPDFEAGPSQPTSEAIRQAAEAAGLAYAFLPVQSAYQSPGEIAQMHELLRQLPTPVLAFCRSGRFARGSHRHPRADCGHQHPILPPLCQSRRLSKPIAVRFRFGSLQTPVSKAIRPSASFLVRPCRAGSPPIQH